MTEEEVKQSLFDNYVRGLDQAKKALEDHAPAELVVAFGLMQTVIGHCTKHEIGVLAMLQFMGPDEDGSLIRNSIGLGNLEQAANPTLILLVEKLVALSVINEKAMHGICHTMIEYIDETAARTLAPPHSSTPIQ